MNSNFNELTNAETERLAILAEECSEVIQIIGKILRHGYYSTHPDDEEGPDNLEMLEKELGHVMAIQKLMTIEELNIASIRSHCRRKIKSVQKYLHHNDISEILKGATK